MIMIAVDTRTMAMIWKSTRNDIVWVCCTCQSDETCVLCHECFRNSNHEGHMMWHSTMPWRGVLPIVEMKKPGHPPGMLWKACMMDLQQRQTIVSALMMRNTPTKLMLNNVEPAVLGAVCVRYCRLSSLWLSDLTASYGSLFHGATTSVSPFGADIMTAALANDILPHTTVNFLQQSL